MANSLKSIVRKETIMFKSRIFALGIAASAGAAVVTATVALGGGSAPATAPATLPAVGSESGQRTIEDGGTGPYKAIAVSDSSIPTHTIYRPGDLTAFGERTKLPILAWGNGACANSSTEHEKYLSEIASHGFLVVAVGPVQAGGGRGGRGMPGRGGGMGSGTTSAQLLDAINWAIAQDKNPDSRYHNKIDTSKIGVFGHSCGGLQAIEVSSDPRISTTIVVDSGILNGGPGGAPAGGAPAPGVRGGALAGMPPLTKDYLTKFHAPVFYLLGGDADIAHDNGMDDLKHIDKNPAFVANKGVGHGGTFAQAHGGDWAMASAAWFEWQLKGDPEAAKLFTGDTPGLGKKDGWTVDKKYIP